MPENLSELEDILAEFENIPEHEALVHDGHEIEGDEHYDLPPEMLEVQNAIEKCSDYDTPDHYSFNPNRLEIEEAMDDIRKNPLAPETQLRYIEPYE